MRFRRRTAQKAETDVSGKEKGFQMSVVKKYRQSTTTPFAITLIVCLMVLVITSSVIIVLALLGRTDIKAQDAISIGVITLNIALAGLIPYLVTKSMSEKDINSRIEDGFITLKKDFNNVEGELSQYINNIKAQNLLSDAHDARMIAYLMLTSKRPDYMWSLSWVMRGLISQYGEDEEAGKHTYSREEIRNPHIVHCLSIMHFDLLCLYRLMKDDPTAWLKRYDELYEKSYINSMGSLESQTTCCRVLRDLVYFYKTLLPNFKENKRGKNGVLRDRLEEITQLSIWLIRRLINYLILDGSEGKAEVIKNRLNALSRFIYFTERGANDVFRKSVEAYVSQMNDKQIDDKLESEIDIFLPHQIVEYPAFEFVEM